MASFRILHLSDFHFCLEANRRNLQDLFRRPKIKTFNQVKKNKSYFVPSSYDPLLAEAVARFVWERRETIDLIIVSGDCATTGLKEDLEVAARFIKSQPSREYRTARNEGTINFGIPVLVLPGNHDRYVDNSMNPGSQNFERHLSPPWRVKEGLGIGVDWVEIVDDNEQLIFAAGDFCLRKIEDAEGVKGYLGQGKAYADTIACLSSLTALKREERPNAALVWVVHFPIESSYMVKLIDGDKLSAAAEKLGIPVILAGHLHERRRRVYSTVHEWLAGSACSVDNEHGNWLHMFKFVTDGPELKMVEVEDFKWSYDADDFSSVGAIQLLATKRLSGNSA